MCVLGISLSRPGDPEGRISLLATVGEPVGVPDRPPTSPKEVHAWPIHRVNGRLPTEP